MKIINYEKIKNIADYNFNDRFNKYKKFLIFLNNPQKELRSIVITGSSGKGSAAFFLTEILQQAKLKVGLYTSPHILSERERIQINFSMIKSSDLKRFKNLILYKLNQFNKKFKCNYEISYFELMTIIAFLYFRENKVDYAVLEVGLGGRWDAVNVVTPLFAVITAVCKDHTNLLGDTLKDILSEKVQIIKKNSLVVTGIKSAGLLNIIEEQCRKVTAKLYRIDDDFKVKFLKISNKHIFFAYNNFKYKIPLYSIDIIKSIGIAIFIGQKLTDLDNNSIQKAICDSVLKGRFHLVEIGRTEVIIDSGHNICAVKSFVKTIKRLNFQNGLLIFTIMQDKDAYSVLKKLSTITGRIILYRLNIEREYDEDVLLEISNKFFSKVGVVSGYKKLQNIMKKEKRVYIVGSFYMTGEFLKKVISKT